MDRLEDLLKVSLIYVSNQIEGEKENDRNVILSPYTQLALSISKQLTDTEDIIKKMPSLVSRKEFSNDPTAEMSSLSITFERSITQIQKGVNRLTQYDTNRVEMSNHQRQHFKSILQNLKLRLSNQVQEFKDMLKIHSANMKLREQRVNQYSGGSSSSASNEANDLQHNIKNSSSVYGSSSSSSSSLTVLPSNLVLQSAAQNYAMFSTPHSSIQQPLPQHFLPLPPPPPLSTDPLSSLSSSSSSIPQPPLTYPSSSGSSSSSTGASSELRRRPNIPNTNGSNNTNSVNTGGTYNPYSQQQSPSTHSSYSSRQRKSPSQSHSLLMRNQYASQESYKSTQKVESAITQLGELFTQMSSLVLEQSETILRIEDDVEEGLQNTVEAHASMESVYAITKGNRGMIIKVFLLLIIFILLFLIIF